jgi:hypothetical protein
MNKNKGKSITEIHFGQVMTEIKPKPDFKDLDQANDAMQAAVHTSLLSWVIDKTLDPEAEKGKQEQLKAMVKDGRRDVAEIVLSVPTTPSFPKTMYQGLLEKTLVPAAQQAFRAYPATRSEELPSPAGQSQLAQILPEVIEQTSRVTPRQLQTR